MTWTIRHNRTPLFFRGEAVYHIVNALIAAGAEVYGSSNATSFDNSGSGAVNYWTSVSVVTTTNAWIRLRFPAVGGFTRELRIQKNASSRRWTFYWSVGSTYFTSGASASAAPTCPTAGDMQYVQNAGGDFEQTFIGDGGTASYELIMVSGDATEGYPFFAGIARRNTSDYAIEKVLFLDVLADSIYNDGDPAVYCCCTEVSAIGPEVITNSIFADTAINNIDTNIGGFFKKGTGEETWCAYPIQANWGYTVSTNAISALTGDVRPGDLNQGSYSCWKSVYGRSFVQGFTTQIGYKGKSRLFRTVSKNAGVFQLDVSRTMLTLGQLVIPWDGKTPLMGT